MDVELAGAMATVVRQAVSTALQQFQHDPNRFVEENDGIPNSSSVPDELDDNIHSHLCDQSAVYNELKLLLKLQLPITDISKRMNLARQTVYNLIEYHNLRPNGKFSVITDGELDDVVIEIKRNHPTSGEIIVQGHLRARGIHVQRHCLRSSLKRVDAGGIEARSLRTIRRRVYFVEGPNFVWHIDGTHKLIRWNLVLHAAIDGYSRLVVFAQCSNNNKSDTVLKLFEKARRKYGAPLRVRTDEGGENVGVWDKMCSLYPENTKPVIVGSSVHNQRIERMHRDFNENVMNGFYNMFYELEHEGIIAIENLTDLFCLHYVFIPHINSKLDQFVMAHNHHSLSTERNRSPLQLFLADFHIRQAQQYANPNFDGGIAASALDRDNLPFVDVPAIQSPLSLEEHEQLKIAIDPLTFDDPIVALHETASFVNRCLS